MQKIKLLLIGLIALILVSQLDAQNKWGVGLTGGYNVSIGGLSDWYSGAGRFGGKLIFNSSKNSEIELEYTYSKFNDGSIADRMFSYRSQIKYAYVNLDANGHPIFITDNEGNYIPIDEIDKTEYPDAKGKNADSLYSSGGSSFMTINSLTVNTVMYLDRMNFLNSRFFFTGGVGFYIYNHQVDSLVYAGKPIDKGKTLYMDPFEDSRVALGLNVGGGLDIEISKNFTFDLRARYNLVIGELRPLEAYSYEGEGFATDDKNIEGLQKVFPIQYIDLSASIKYYFH